MHEGPHTELLKMFLSDYRSSINSYPSVTYPKPNFTVEILMEELDDLSHSNSKNSVSSVF